MSKKISDKMCFLLCPAGYGGQGLNRVSRLWGIKQCFSVLFLL